MTRTVIRSLRDELARQAAATITYLSLERDLFQRHGPNAVRHLGVDDRRRLARAAFDVGWRRVQRHARIARVATLRRWWRDLVAQQPRKRGGRQATPPEVVALIVAMAVDNSLGNDAWGRRQIAGELLGLGITVSPSTIRRILMRRGIPPAPQRGRAWDGPVAIAASDPRSVAIDFTTIRLAHGDPQRPLYLLSVIHIGSRQVEILGLTEHPDERWMAQIARNLTMAGTGFLHRVAASAVIMDRDTKFTDHFRHVLAEAGFAALRTPPKMPQCNGYIERWFRTLKTSLIRKVLWLDERAVLDGVIEFAHEHYLRERPHQALGNRPPKPASELPNTARSIIRTERFAGLIHVYRRAS